MTPTTPVVPYKDQAASKKEQVATMFDNISPKYDFLNRLLSFGIDIWWRKRAVALLKPYKPRLILDVATGTGDFALEALSLQPEKIIGVDISEGMLAHGRVKMSKRGLDNKIELRSGDSENLPFTDNTFDAVTVAFGVRNFENLLQGLKGMNRVLKPGGVAVVLEFSRPRVFPVKQLYGFYSRYILPGIGRLFSQDRSAYTYLPESVEAFPDGEAFLAVFREAGFQQVQAKALTFGIVSLYFGKK